MTDATRRAFLALGAVALGGGAGCLGGAPRESSESTTTAGNETGTADRSTETRTDSPGGQPRLAFNRAERLHRLDASFPQRDVGTYYLALLTSADHAEAFPTDRFGNEEAAAFVADTDFDRRALVVLHDRQSSSHPDLELLGTNRDGYTVRVDVRYPGTAGTADVTTDTLLVRVPAGDDPVRAAGATLRPQYGDPVRFRTANAYDRLPAFDPGGDLVFRNRDCAEAQLPVTVTRDGDLFFSDGVTLAPASVRRIGGLVSHPGEWTVAVRAGEESHEQSWSVTGGPPGDLLVDVDGDGGVSLERRPDGADGTDLGACETAAYPYESSDPAENLDDPVDLWVLDHADGEHHLTVTIRDGDTEVFSGEFATRAGYDKVRRAGLLAKKTTYAVEVTTDAGATATRSVTVREGAGTLEVRVTESGDLAVSLG
ncbi:MAG: hypothetical protein ABEJ22_01780 [Haloferacaceae archaeon]